MFFNLQKANWKKSRILRVRMFFSHAMKGCCVFGRTQGRRLPVRVGVGEKGLLGNVSRKRKKKGNSPLPPSSRRSLLIGCGSTAKVKKEGRDPQSGSRWNKGEAPHSGRGGFLDDPTLEGFLAFSVLEKKKKKNPVFLQKKRPPLRGDCPRGFSF